MAFLIQPLAIQHEGRLNVTVDPRQHRAVFPFLKMHGLFNCFVILDLRGSPQRVPAEDVQRICDVRSGVGAEQLLAIEPPTDAGRSSGADVFMRIYNIDGAEVSACGNATRCVAYHLMRESGHETVTIETAAGLLRCSASGDQAVSVQFGPIGTAWNEVPLTGPADTSCLPIESGPLKGGFAVSVGNPHTVFFVDKLADVDIPRFAPPIQNHPIFESGTNVGVGEIVDACTIKLAVWERPGMLTQACGTGACAAAFVARQRRFISTDSVMVHLPGGTLRIDLREHGVTMTGPVATCCSGYLPLQLS
ncbi:diaminopimelate epimerase [Rhizobium vallis]|uniref:Diaminopimelate epimerase n=1 Tax=Rhizobium vallis TaxID=634290 RepID=A0A3S0SM10_9HYPH|nr:diaminopimelate epimerase [Rhizobium vallis]RUM20415.1 diaminopimelate epimerase [Rhizobium vallis]